MIGGVPVVTGPAEIDVITADQLRTALLEAAAHGQATVVADLTHSFAASATVQALVLPARTLKERGGILALRHPQPAVARLALTGADQMFAIEEDRRV
jgi:anti-anti-sigma factor